MCRNHTDTAFTGTMMRMPFTSMMIPAYKSLTAWLTYRVLTRSSAVPSSYVDVHVCSQPLFVRSSVFPKMQRDERVLVVWSENLDTIIPLCRDFEDSLIKLVWNRHTVTGISPGPSIPATPAGTSAVASVADSASDVLINEKAQEQETAPDPDAKAVSGGSLWGWRIGSRAKRAPAPQDVEKGGASFRPVKYFGPVYSGLGLALSTCAVSSSTEQCSMLTDDLKSSLPAVSAACSKNIV